MGAMKKFLLLGTALFAIAICPCLAEVTIEQSTDAEYLINSGFSQATAEEVFMAKNRVNGKPIEPLYEKPQNKFARLYHKLYTYIDSGQEQYDRLHHDIRLSPHYTDL